VTTPRAAHASPAAQVAAVLTALPLLVQHARRAQGLSVRAAAAQIGCSFSMISRFENGRAVSPPNAVALLRWLYQLGAASDYSGSGTNRPSSST
jgi:transcriptional regulator with XRE-family HTH domain